MIVESVNIVDLASCKYILDINIPKYIVYIQSDFLLNCMLINILNCETYVNINIAGNLGECFATNIGHWPCASPHFFEKKKIFPFFHNFLGKVPFFTGFLKI